MKTVLFKDRLIPKEEVSVSIDDRGYYFGDGVYDVFRIYNGRLYEQEAHLLRLERSAWEARIALPYPIREIGRKLEELLNEEKVLGGTLYVQITRGEAERIHHFPERAFPVLSAFCKSAERPLEKIRGGIRALLLPDLRWLRCDIKSLNMMPNVMAKQQAIDSGYDEAIFERNGIVTECTSSNLLIAKEGTLYTHPANEFILHGITRGVVIRLAAELGVPLLEQAFTVEQLMKADEVMVIGTMAEVTPVVQIDGKPVGAGQVGPLAQKLQAAFEATFDPDRTGGTEP
ncbi:D-amino-acid transaminase [Paenibacillus hodogayensis]|uniref:D-alanine aminotransferase n=1 Tax=Paenibacillus hodogayensis TaxID=279208 RepID=A0ABV5VVU1_9BACL